jgi:sugar phosphate isomerase/epimerase
MKKDFNRRDFLMGASMLPLAVAASSIGLGAIPAFADKQPIQRIGGPMLKVSLNAYSFTKLLNAKVKHGGEGIDLFDLVDFCAKYNIDGFDATGYFFPGFPEVPKDEYIFRLKRKAFENGIGISGSGVRNNFTTADKDSRAKDVEIIKQWVEVASKLGAPVLRVFSDTQMRDKSWQDVAPGCTREQVEEWIAANLKECAAHGEKHGVIIGVQNHGDFLKTGDNLLSLIKRVDSDWCGAIVDTGYFRAEDPYKEMEKVAPYAVNWQVKQSPFDVKSGKFDVPLDLNKLLKIVRASGYRGYLPIETLSAPGKPYDPYQVVPKFVSELRQAIVQSA